MLGIPILIRIFLFQLSSLPDKLEPHTRYVINSFLQFCAPLKLLAITDYGHSVWKPHLDFLVRKPICPRLFVIAVVTPSNIVCTRKQMMNGVVGGGSLFLVFVLRQLRQEQLYPVRIKVPESGQRWALREGQKNSENVVTPQMLAQPPELVAVGQPRSEVGVCACQSLHWIFPL